MENILKLTQINKSFPGVKALSDVNLTVRKGEVHALVGENGAGKSTLMKIKKTAVPSGLTVRKWKTPRQSNPR